MVSLFARALHESDTYGYAICLIETWSSKQQKAHRAKKGEYILLLTPMHEAAKQQLKCYQNNSSHSD